MRCDFISTRFIHHIATIIQTTQAIMILIQLSKYLCTVILLDFIFIILLNIISESCTYYCCSGYPVNDYDACCSSTFPLWIM